MDTIIIVVLAVALTISVVTDLKSMRIPNKITLPLMLAGLAIHGLTNGLDGLLFSLSGLGVGLGVMLVPYLFGVMGGGDVKLMAGVGACLGTELTIEAFLLTSLAGGLYALAMLLARPGRSRRIFSNIWTSFWLFLTTKKFDYSPDEKGEKLPRLCYGVAIAAGTVATVIHAVANAQLLTRL